MLKTSCRIAMTVATVAGLCAAASAQRTAPAAVLSGTPNNLAWTGHTPKAPAPLPRSQPPAKDMLVVDLRNVSPEWQRLTVTLQGLVNRDLPRIYTITFDEDKGWLDHMVARGWVKRFRTVSGPRELLTKYRKSYRGVVIPDAKVPGSMNVAFMLASVDNGLVASPALARDLRLPVLHDLRGRWKTNAQAITWSFDNLWPRLNHSVISISKDTNLNPRDYLVQHKVFTFWITGPVDGVAAAANPTNEARAMEKILARIPANIPCMGYPYAGENVGIQEGPGVSLLSQFGKYLIPTDMNPNLSVHTGIRIAALKQTLPPAPKLDRSKVYVSFIVSDGDNPQVWSKDSYPTMWKSPARGEIPIGWTVSPSARQLIPAVMDYFYHKATPNDAFLSAVSGVGYMYPDQYARRFKPDDRKRVFNGFLDQTAAAMKAMDLHALWLMGITDDALMARYAERIPNVAALFPDYGRRVSSYENATYPTVNGVPVFHASNQWGTGGPPKERIAQVVNDVRAMVPKARPAFLHIFVNNWGGSIPWMKEVLKQLGPDYVAVRPEHLGALYREEMVRQQVIVDAPERIRGVSGRPLTVSVGVRNATLKPMTVRVDYSGAMRSPVNVSSTLPPGVPVPFPITAAPETGDLTMRVTGPFGERRFTATVGVTPAEEILGDLPTGALRFAGLFEAENLSHRPLNPGTEIRDAAASGGRAWQTPTGDAEGVVVYGPYISLEPGKYLALFRLKRGEGSGALATLDVVSNGANDKLSKRILNADDLPEGTYRSVVVPFTYTGGALETRVDWAGNAPLTIDAVTVYEAG